MGNKKYKWGVIGCGNVTEVKSGPAYSLVSDFELYAVMRRDLEKAKNYALRHAVPKYYDNADELINDPEVNVVYIATPPDSHAYYALKVAEVGKPCCIEKPMALNYKECVQIESIFRKKNIPLFVAYYRRSLPRFQKIKEWLEKLEIGEVRNIHWSYTRTASSIDMSKAYNWRTDKKIAYGGYFDDLASHGIDLFVYLLGNIEKANGVAVNQQGLYSAKDAVTGNWLHASGITGSGFWNFGANEREDVVTIYGSKGKIVFSVFKDESIVLYKEGCEIEEFFIENPKHIQQYHVQNMSNHLARISEHPSTGKTAMHTSWVLDQILGKKD